MLVKYHVKFTIPYKNIINKQDNIKYKKGRGGEEGDGPFHPRIIDKGW